MPQGKGTYGSQVGRPKKSPKYKGAPLAPKVAKPKPKAKAKPKKKGWLSKLGKALKPKVVNPAMVAARKKEKAAKAEKKVGKKWTKAVKARKEAGGPNLSTLVKARGMHKKGSAEYAKIQNKINEAYGVKKRHKAAPKKAAPKAPSKDYSQGETLAGPEDYQLGGKVEPPTAPSMSPSPAYKEGGKVDSNAGYDWPTRDARSGFGKKK